MTTAPSPTVDRNTTVPGLAPSDAYRALLVPKRPAYGRFLKWVGVLAFLAYLVWMGELAAEAAMCYSNEGIWNRKASACVPPTIRIELVKPPVEKDVPMGPVL
jgi:hypothetical protein